MAFEHLHPPAPFNPDADPLAGRRYAHVTASMVEDGLYATMDREERREEWARRYEAARSGSLRPLAESLEVVRNAPDPDDLPGTPAP